LTQWLRAVVAPDVADFTIDADAASEVLADTILRLRLWLLAKERK